MCCVCNRNLSIPAPCPADFKICQLVNRFRPSENYASSVLTLLDVECVLYEVKYGFLNVIYKKADLSGHAV